MARLSGVTKLYGSWRYPEPLAPVAAAERADLALPTRTELVLSVRTVDAQLTLVEGAGGLLVELGADGVTLRDIAAELAAPVLVVVRPGLGTLNHTALTLESLAGQDIPCAGLVIGAWPSQPGPAETDNREALARLGPVARRAARRRGHAEPRRVRGHERGRLRLRLGREPGLMVHSVELVFDPDTEAAIRHIWDGLREAGIPSQAPASRPHATLTVAERIDPEVDQLLSSLADRFPLSCRIGAPLLFGRSKVVLARLVVPTTALLDVHADVHRLCMPHLQPGPMPNALPGQWTGHVTLARRLVPGQLGRALRIAGKPQEIAGSVIGLRRWDGNKKQEFAI